MTAGDSGGMSPAAGRRQWHARRAAVAELAAAVMIAGLVLGRQAVEDSLQKLAGLDWTWFLLAIICEFVSLTAFGLSRRRLLRADGNNARLGSVMAITYASNALSMTVPFAGAQLAVVFSYRQFRHRGLSQAITGWALAVSAILSMSALAVVLVARSLASRASLATPIGLVRPAAPHPPGRAPPP